MTNEEIIITQEAKVVVTFAARGKKSGNLVPLFQDANGQMTPTLELCSEDGPLTLDFFYLVCHWFLQKRKELTKRLKPRKGVNDGNQSETALPPTA